MEGVNPIIIVLMFAARCLVPLIIMLGISYLLHRAGLLQDAPPGEGAGRGENEKNEGGLVHGKP